MARPNQQTPPNVPPSVSDGSDVDFMASTNFVPSQIGETDDVQGDQAQPELQPNLIPDEMVREALGGLFTFVFSAIAQQRGDHWLVKPYEEQALSRSWTPLLQLLLNHLGSQEQGMIALAIMTTGAVVGGKVAQDATLRASKTASIKTPPLEG